MTREHITKADSYLVTHTVQPGENGQRLDLFLKEKYRKLSREYLQKAIKQQRVTLNHEATKPSRVLRTGDKVYVLSTRGNEPRVDFNYKVLFEDEHILVVDKPGHLPVHPTGRYFFHTLLTQLRVVNGNEVDQGGEFYIVHRLDRETSGVLVIGKTSSAAASLVDQFSRRATDKEYLAIVQGVMPEDSYVVDVPLASDPKSTIKLKMYAVEMGADGEPLYVPKKEMLPARTEIQVVERLEKYTVVRCMPHTGRQHQIRVHLHHLGFPILGDKLYGRSDDFFLGSLKEDISIEIEPGKSLTRHALHAHRLEFLHPVTKEKKVFTSGFPEELENFLRSVRSASDSS